tara:strand:+ start:473 stop:874 length:402 start_codon:yes stop_codon:yes gene_type:complete
MSKWIRRRPTPHVYSRELRHNQAMLAEAREALKRLEAEDAQRSACTKVTCPKCKGAFPIGQATWKDHYFYVSPFSCSEGDYWRRALSTNKVCDMDHVDCTLCSYEIYVYNYPEREALLALRPYAARRIEDRRR